MPTLREYLYRAEECLRLAEDTDQAFAREALLELAAKFHAIAVQLERGVPATMRAAPTLVANAFRPMFQSAQELLLLWPTARSDQKGSDVNVGELAA
jgi:hypothetical protein